MRQLFLLLILTSHAGDSEAQVYKWVDENGTVHFSDLPPPGDPAEQVELARQPSEQSLQQAREDAARRLQNQRADSDARRETEESRRLEKEEGEQQAAEMQIRCTYVRPQLEVVQMQRPVYRENDAGEREYADDDYRAAEQERFRREVEQYCE